MADAHVLLVGLDGPDRERFVHGARGTGTTLRLIEVTALQDALATLSTLEVQCVIAGVGAAIGGWEPAASEIRRLAPNAALIAVTAANPVTGWDDVVRPHERDPALIVRVIRSGLAIAAANRRLVHWAMRDPLTDLLNRRGLQRVLVREESERERGQGPLAALLVDCDNFKSINDRFGLSIGDDVLRRLAEALSASVRARDTVARVGGDEFVVLLPHTRTWEAVEVAERIRQHVRDAVTLPDGTTLSVSIGVRRLDERITEVRDLVEATEAGLKQSKASGKDQVRVVDPAGSGSASVGEARSGIDPEASLPPGTQLFSYGTLEVVDLETGRATHRIVAPELTAESALVLATHRATRSAWDLAWFTRGLGRVEAVDLPVHSTLFPATLLETPLEAVCAAVPARIPLDRVTLTIDDQFLTGDPSTLASRLWPLRGRGVAVCIDTSDLGRTCLESLILLRPERVRIDASLVTGVGGSKAKQAVLARFVKVCDALGIESIADGIDDLADRRAVVELGIRRGIGRAVAGRAGPS